MQTVDRNSAQGFLSLYVPVLSLVALACPYSSFMSPVSLACLTVLLVWAFCQMSFPSVCPTFKFFCAVSGPPCPALQWRVPKLGVMPVLLQLELALESAGLDALSRMSQELLEG